MYCTWSLDLPINEHFHMPNPSHSDFLQYTSVHIPHHLEHNTTPPEWPGQCFEHMSTFDASTHSCTILNISKRNEVPSDIGTTLPLHQALYQTLYDCTSSTPLPSLNWPLTVFRTGGEFEGAYVLCEDELTHSVTTPWGFHNDGFCNSQGHNTIPEKETRAAIHTRKCNGATNSLKPNLNYLQLFTYDSAVTPQ